jgi:aminopeptidase N
MPGHAAFMSASDPSPQPVYRHDYRPSAFRCTQVDLDVHLDEAETVVRCLLQLQRDSAQPRADLILDGEELDLRAVLVDGEVLAPECFRLDARSLTIFDLPDRCSVATEVVIWPQNNTRLSGLYRSGDMFCTQCEAMGFRRIAFMLDRPDVMARYRTRITASRERYPVLLSNGNRLETTALGDGRHSVQWEDPFPKPSYLFALVAGDLHCHAGQFRTMGGRDVRLEIWVEHRNADKCAHALKSLQKAMAWDEQRFDREYDLDLYMIVAVDDFNMGAMENKGLNIFNSKFVLARPDTATDHDYEAIEGVIAHEYFHNWTGNRITCRDWFQLTLKEGLTVFRDQEFTAEMTSPAVKRIDDVNLLKTVQFPQDDGPMAHPIRPDSYISMDNFYTITVYEKGAEVIRLYQTLLGETGFRAGMDLYFQRHDEQSVTCDDFRAAMADANGVDLEQFARWYSQAGTPELSVSCHYDADARSAELLFLQRYTGRHTGQEPVVIPVRFGVLGADGGELPVVSDHHALRQVDGAWLVEVTENEQRLVLRDLDERPVLSLLRGFSAPVKLVYEAESGDLALRLAHDRDDFNRWQAGQDLASELILRMVASDELPANAGAFIEAWLAVVQNDDLDGALTAQALTLPSERLLAQVLQPVPVEALHRSRRLLRDACVRAGRDQLLQRYQRLQAADQGGRSPAEVGNRRLKNLLLALLCSINDPEGIELAWQQFSVAQGMTDQEGALQALIDTEHPRRTEALGAFQQQWQHVALVMDKWFSLQARAQHPAVLTHVHQLLAHPAFTLSNPNRVRSLIGVFSQANHRYFHDASGDGYRLLADVVCELDPRNPQVAARLVSGFNAWRRYDKDRQARMRQQLERIRDLPGLSKDSYEIVTRALAD